MTNNPDAVPSDTMEDVRLDFAEGAAKLFSEISAMRRKCAVIEAIDAYSRMTFYAQLYPVPENSLTSMVIVLDAIIRAYHGIIQIQLDEDTSRNTKDREDKYSVWAFLYPGSGDTESCIRFISYLAIYAPELMTKEVAIRILGDRPLASAIASEVFNA